ncbi:MAG: zf-HC2 domain-containing protein [Actinomycetota bacterium]|nr:zf-HC2 domain-containing protein [Actinomycetota bacterium]
MGIATDRSTAFLAGAEVACVDFIDAASPYVDGSLTVAEAKAFAEHLMLCEGCRAYRAQFQTTIDLLAAGAAARLTPRTRQRILDAYRRDWRGG